MSRATFTSDKFVFSFGVDHTPMGTFFQIYDKKWDGDGPVVDADALFGIRFAEKEEPGDPDPLDNFRKEAPDALAWVASLIPSWKPGLSFAEEDIIGIGKALGVTNPNFEKKVYELWD